jgi:hypothetical protein
VIGGQISAYDVEFNKRTIAVETKPPIRHDDDDEPPEDIGNIPDIPLPPKLSDQSTPPSNEPRP